MQSGVGVEKSQSPTDKRPGAEHRREYADHRVASAASCKSRLRSSTLLHLTRKGFTHAYSFLMVAMFRERSFVIMLGKWWVLVLLIAAAIFLVAPILVDANHWFPRKKK